MTATLPDAPTTTPAPGPRRRRPVTAVLAVLPLAFVAALVGWPLATVLSRGLGGPALDLLSTGSTWRILGYTAAQAAASTLLSVVAALPAAYALHRLAVPGRRLLLAVLTVPFVLPTVVVGLAFRTLLPAGWSGTTAAVLLAHVFFNIGLVVRVVGGLWGHLDPRLEQVAATLGLGPWAAFRQVTWPLLRPAVLASAALVFLFTFTSFGVILVLGDPALPTVEVEIYRRTMQLLDLSGAALLAIVQLLVVAGALLASSALQRRLAVAQHLQSDRVVLAPVRGTGRWALTGLVWLQAAAVAAPVVALVLRSVRVGSGWGLDWYAALAVPSDPTTRAVPALASLRVSLSYAAVATVLAVAVGVLAATAIASARRGSALLDTTVMLPLGVSAVTVGFGLLLASIRGPVDLRGVWLIVPLGQAVVAVPLVVRTVLPVLRSVDPRLRQVAATLGAGPVRAWVAVEGALLLRVTGVAAGLACAVSLGEFGATAFLARTDTPTLPLQVVRLLGRPGESNAGQAAALAVVLVGLTALVVLLAERLRPARSSGW